MKKFYFACVTMLLLLGSCAKDDPSEGCTDAAASNYDEKAVENCCCNYKGKVLFFFGKESSDQLAAMGAKNITFYIDGKNVGSYSASRYFAGTPGCDMDGTITIEKDLGTEKSATYKYLVTDEVGNQIWTGNQTWTANTCTRVKIDQ